jgi:DNA-directed RNA polymerase specialized sigma24 family protein
MSTDWRQSLGSLLQDLAAAPREAEFWGILFEQVWPFVYAHNYRLFRGDAALAEDITFDVLLHFAKQFGPEAKGDSRRSFEQFATSNQLLNYLLVAGRHRRIDHLRSRARFVEFPSEDVDASVSHTPSPEELVSLDEIIEKALEGLKRDERLLAELLIVGYKPHEIIALTGYKGTLGALYTRLTRIRDKIAPLFRSAYGRKGP